MGKWHGIMRVTELVHRDARGREILRKENLPNGIHILGEDFILKVLFGGEAVPDSYFIGLDSRGVVQSGDTIADLEEFEPNEFGYERRSVGSNDFSIVSGTSGSMQANSPMILFTALGGSWGPVRNIFLSTGLGHSSPTVLLSSAPIGQNLVVSPGETVTMRMAMSLSAC